MASLEKHFSKRAKNHLPAKFICGLEKPVINEESNVDEHKIFKPPSHKSNNTSNEKNMFAVKSKPVHQKSESRKGQDDKYGKRKSLNVIPFALNLKKERILTYCKLRAKSWLV